MACTPDPRAPEFVLSALYNFAPQTVADCLHTERVLDGWAFIVIAFVVVAIVVAALAELQRAKIGAPT